MQASFNRRHKSPHRRATHVVLEVLPCGVPGKIANIDAAARLTPGHTDRETLKIADTCTAARLTP